MCAELHIGIGIVLVHVKKVNTQHTDMQAFQPGEQ